MKNYLQNAWWFVKIVAGSAIFSLGFDLFLLPNGLNSGGVSGLAMILAYLIPFGTVGFYTGLMNLVLFIIGGLKVGKRFFFGSLAGAVAISLTLDLFTLLPAVETGQPLLAAVYGGVICGLGLGIVFVSGASTGGSDIVVRLLKMKWQHVPIGTINIGFDMTVAVLTGLAYGDIQATLYSGVAIFACGKVIDAVVYSFDFSYVAVIISQHSSQIADAINQRLERGATFLRGEGSYSHQQTQVILTAVKKHQLADLKALVAELDPDAFVIMQEAHQVLGDGFARNTKDMI
ncbi:MAG: YitT family protein [Firmicutes bacterium]|nr:YitT family protein [Bacillota bacterium]